MKLVARGKLPEGSKHVHKPKNVPTFGDKQPEVAIYDRARFWCLTGHRLPGAALCSEPRQEALEELLSRLFPSKPASNGKPSNGHTGGSWFDRLLSDCASAQSGERSERDFALCAAAARHGFTADEVWARVNGTGKFAESGRDYFDRTWQRASEAAANDPPKRQRKSKPVVSGDSQSLDLRDASARTDTANGRRFVLRHGDCFRHCALWSKDLIYDGKRWANDVELRADAMAKVIADEIWQAVGKLLQEVDNDTATELVRFAKYTASGRGRMEMLKAARSEPSIPIQPDTLDAHPFLFNCVNGTVDLKTSILLPHDREHYITKICPHEYLQGPEAECPIWETTVETILGGVPKLISFVRRLFGASLVGEVIDHVLPILWGTGSNGKSLLIEILLEAIATDYADKGAADLLLATKGDRHPTEKADLFGKRLVVHLL